MKPVDFGFVNFVRLNARFRCCEAEIRLNAPFAGPNYRDTDELFFDGPRCKLRPGMRGNGRVVDYAVRMRRFDQRLLLSNLLSNGEQSAADIDAAATRLATIHRHARRANRFVRACHGDLHFGNIVRYRRHALRWIDLTCDLAFLLKGLRAHGRAAYVHRLLNRYLEPTADFAGLAALRPYVAFCALVRALVALLKARSPAPHDALPRGGDASLDLIFAASEARLMCEPGSSRLLCHGFSGSDKSVASRVLAKHVWVRRMGEI